MDIHTYDSEGNLTSTEVGPDYAPANAAALDAIATARAEAERLSPTGATRQALEALVAALEALI